jgi:hypothetical protein
MPVRQTRPRIALRAMYQVVCAILACALSTAALQAQDLSVPDDAGRQLVRLAADQDWAKAEALARKILAIRPGDVSALVVLARARRAAGDAAGAREAALRADANARTDEEHYVAAIEIAAASYDLGKPMIAQLWLRRATQMAPSDALRTRTLRNLQAVAAATPWSLEGQFSIAPSSNVNHGSLADTIDIGGLPFTLNPDAKALAGVEINLGLRARYRFRGLMDLPAEASFAAFTQQIALSASAQNKAPDATGSDYAYDIVEFALGQALTDASAPVRYRVDGALGKAWYGGAELSQYARVAAHAQWGDARRAVNTVTLQAERQARQDDPHRSATILNLGLRRDWRLASGDALAMALRAQHTQSNSVEIDNDALIGSLSYDFGTVLGGRLSLGSALEIEHRRYDASVYSNDTRRDWRHRLAVTVGFPKSGYYGFTPQVQLQIEKVDSTVDFYDQSDATLLFGLKSVF